jgi:hypothetical protein|tara:strand:+ start:362 stop:682 length:321 start_codon:yes stop_codon:yes gene_type:complete
MIQLDKKYTTRDGREVRIHAIDGPDEEYPVISSIKNDDVWIVCRYEKDGTNYLYRDAELIEVALPYEFEVSFAGDVPDEGVTFSVTRKMENSQIPNLYTLTLTEVQ